MSFRLFVYYCAICGAWFAFFGWLLSLLTDYLVNHNLGEHPAAQVFFRGVAQGTSLGVILAFGLGMVDAFWNISSRSPILILLRGIVVGVIGFLFSLVGAMVGQGCVSITGFDPLIVFGWIFVGLLIGATVGVYDVVARLISGGGLSGAIRKIVNGVIGGGVGGFLGGILYLLLSYLLHLIFTEPYSSRAWGFVVLGACIGLFVGLAQVILKEAWLKVEAGFRPGRELIIAKELLTIGRAESCDIGLFGDNGIEKVHAKITQKAGRYVLEDTGTPGGTYVNDEEINGPTPLRDGDRIRVGKSVIRFSERQKKK
jgi:hypothetical protein